MPQAVVDPEELTKVAHNLKQFNANLKQSMSQLNGQFNQLGSTWRDQEHQKFAQEYQQAIRLVDRFLQSADQHIPLFTDEDYDDTAIFSPKR
ncbi:MAG: WXG100 family type VII secretion target [bacterium]|nr:WXG100 family type VII secretion target [bacterium]